MGKVWLGTYISVGSMYMGGAKMGGFGGGGVIIITNMK